MLRGDNGRYRFVALGLVAPLFLGILGSCFGNTEPSLRPSLETPFIDKQSEPVATTGFGETLVVHREDRRLSIGLAGSGSIMSLASFDLPANDQYVGVRQLICADGTGPERTLVLFGATSPEHVVESLWMELFSGRFTKTSNGLFLFLGTETPVGGKVWALKVQRRTVESGNLVLAMPADPKNPPADLCGVWPPEPSHSP